MKNITLSIDERVLEKVRRYASESGSSVNQLVREFLTGIAERNDRADQVKRQIRDLSEQSTAQIGSKSWTRDELHER
ncbi:MAG: DUF6364 family protein [Methylococcaceae bacterium]|nr:DUF6364 family protein [Methylococcaceae bacterium]